IRRWPIEYLPKIYEAERVDRVMDVDQKDAEEMMRQMAQREGIFAGVSSGGAMTIAIELATELEAKQQSATIVSIVCDRGDRYLSTGVY
ncbi:MAG: pyridoxal-phosphate dependent enzyme, partial [Pseudomonadota bacterium]